MALPPELTAKLAKPIRLLASDSKGEAFAALCAIARLLETYNQSFHTLADHVAGDNGAADIASLPDAVKEKLRLAVEAARADAFAEGVRTAEAKQHGTGAFRNTDGTLDWKEVALYCQREKHRLPDKHHEFIDDMAARTVWDREPTPKQHQYLHSLFFKLGGKIT